MTLFSVNHFRTILNWGQDTWGFDQDIASRVILESNLCRLPKNHNLYPRLRIPIPTKQIDDTATCFHGTTWSNCNRGSPKLSHACKWWHFFPSDSMTVMYKKYVDILNKNGLKHHAKIFWDKFRGFIICDCQISKDLNQRIEQGKQPPRVKKARYWKSSSPHPVGPVQLQIKLFWFQWESILEMKMYNTNIFRLILAQILSQRVYLVRFLIYTRDPEVKYLSLDNLINFSQPKKQWHILPKCTS